MEQPSSRSPRTSPKAEGRRKQYRDHAHHSGLSERLERLKLTGKGDIFRRHKKDDSRPDPDHEGGDTSQVKVSRQNDPTLPAQQTNVTHIGRAGDPYSETVADRNASHNDERLERKQPVEHKSSNRKSLPPVPIKQEDGGFALGRTEDTLTHTTYAPAVTHETRTVNTHEIVTKPITREIHNHHVVHRVLPIDEVEVLPSRHFVPQSSGDGLREIPAPRTTKGVEDRIKAAFSQHQEEARRRTHQNKKPDVFDQGDQHTEWVSSTGVDCSESMWVHSPQVATAARDAGETVPVCVPPPDR